MKRAIKSSTWYRKKCVAIAKRLALERDEYTCQHCGRKKGTYQIHASHVFPEGKYHGMSADVENIKALCAYCHMFWWHKHPTEAGEWFRRTFPERYRSLKAKSMTTIKTDWKNTYENIKDL